MEDNCILYETQFWRVILIDDQSYLGRCVIDLKRECGELSNLTLQEWTDFHENIVKKLELAFKQAFNTTLLILLCLIGHV